MTWNLHSDRPIFRQIVERLQQDIVSGIYAPGDKLDSVRDLATAAAVNPNTMQKALAELERTGLILSQRTSGRYVTEDTSSIASLKETLAKKVVERYMLEMKRLGYSTDDAKIFIRNFEEDK